jgi:methyl-accepting chemotaxis protein
MSNNPVTNAFFFGRALAEVMSEKLEETFTNTMSDLGKFDAEQRENLREFMEEVQSRAERASGTTVYPRSSNSSNGSNNSSSGTSSYVGFNIDTSSTNSDDLQTMLDQLRAEIATLRTELKKYR